MQLQGKHIVLTGAAGGMGRLLAQRLAQKGAKLALVDANEKALNEVAATIAEQATAITADLSSVQGCIEAAESCKQALAKVDMLINLAGLNSFASFADESPEYIELMMRVNVLAPMQLTRALLPELLKQDKAQIVNVGSVFGSIGFAWFTTYSASKFALRGFSEALRRELTDTGVGVTYIAPRAVKTPMNNDAVMKMGEATGMNMDEPDMVVGKMIQAIEADKKDCYLGFPESLFVRINGILPRIVDMALAGQNKIAKTFLK
jgi:short-subunit dehydrogenase